MEFLKTSPPKVLWLINGIILVNSLVGSYEICTLFICRLWV